MLPCLDIYFLLWGRSASCASYVNRKQALYNDMTRCASFQPASPALCRLYQLVDQVWPLPQTSAAPARAPAPAA
jgi:hypothetical protein